MEYNKLPRIYIADFLTQDKEIELNKQQIHYLKNVMRLKEGSLLRIFNSTAGEWLGQLNHATMHFINLQELLRPPSEETTNPDLWLLFSPLKNHRTNFLLEKATELGVSHFIPIIYERSIVRDLNITKAEIYLIEAAEQCERLTIPTIAAPCKLELALKNWPSDRKLLFMNEKEAQNAIPRLPKQKLAIMVGPEGGFTNNELDLLNQTATSVHLGPYILRAETAAITAIAVFQLGLGNFDGRPRS